MKFHGFIQGANVSPREAIYLLYELADSVGSLLDAKGGSDKYRMKVLNKMKAIHWAIALIEEEQSFREKAIEAGTWKGPRDEYIRRFIAHRHIASEA